MIMAVTNVECLPHARGDEPGKKLGMTAIEIVCPTHVGMNRI